MAFESQIHFCTDVKVLNEWATRTGLTLPPSGDALSQSYTRAHPWLLQLRDSLVQRCGWQSLASADRMLFSTKCNIQGAAGETLTLTLPEFPTSFFSPNRQSSFQGAFHSPIFSSCRHSVQPVQDILHLLQCLMPGLLTINMVEQVPGQGTWTTTRGLPPVEWVDMHKEQLVTVFGAGHFAKLRNAAATKTMSFKTTCK